MHDLWHFVLGRPALVVLLVTAVVAWPLSRAIADRFGRSRVATVLFVASVGVVMALTLTPNYPAPGEITDMPPHFLQYIGNRHMVWAALTSPPADSEQIANIALYVPVGLFGRFVWRSTIGAAAFGIALTVAIETCQYGIVGRDGSLTDIRNNAAGAVLGALIGAVAVGMAQRRSARKPVNDSKPIR